jgi:hypothetical protein
VSFQMQPSKLFHCSADSHTERCSSQASSGERASAERGSGSGLGDIDLEGFASSSSPEFSGAGSGSGLRLVGKVISDERSMSLKRPS